MSLPAGSTSSTTTATTAPAINPPGVSPASSTSTASTSTTSTTNSLAKPPPKQPQKTTWQILKKLLPSSGAVQIFIGLVCLVLTILGIKWAFRSYNMARWTELKDFRDDCRSVQASGGPFSTACKEALSKELEPPPYTPSSYLSRLRKRDFDATWAKEELYQVMIEVRRVLSIRQAAFLRGCHELLFEGPALEGRKAVTRVVLQTARKITSAAEHFGISKETATVWIDKSRSWMTSIAVRGCRLLVAIWANTLILGLSLMSSLQWARKQATYFAHNAQTISASLSTRFPGLSLFSENSTIRKLVSFFFHPWTFDSTLFLISTAQRFRDHDITSFQYVLFINILLLHHLILWPFWCNDCHGTLWRVITPLSDTVCCALALLQSKQAKYNQHRVNQVGAYSANMAAAMIAVELAYELLLLVNGFRHSPTTFGVLFGTAVIFLAVWLINIKKRSGVLVGISGLLLTHIIEVYFIRYCNGWVAVLARAWGRAWKVTIHWLWKCGKLLFWGFYVVDVWAMFTLGLQRDMRLRRQRYAA